MAPRAQRCSARTLSFTPNSAAAERVFSKLKNMFGEKQQSANMDYIQAAVMLAHNKRIEK